MLTEYKNETFTDYSAPENKEAMLAALALIDRQKGMDYPLIIGGEEITKENKKPSINPSNPDDIIGIVSNAEITDAENAVQTAYGTFEKWSMVDPAERAEYLFKAAAVIRRRKHEFSAWLVEEAGKNWPEADGDTAEAIDFLEYYGRQMVRISEGVTVVQLAGENNVCNYIPLGVGVIIAPWNFPLAILVGMTAAAVVTGNTVVMKPASTTPVIAAKFMEVLREISLPAGVVNYLPGAGGAIGDYLVSHPLVRFINFTGSRDVGLRINKLAAELAPGQKWIKRVVCELGGKDAIIVDNEADLEEAADGIVASAFGFQGQKCSACSRAIVVDDVYDKVVDMIVEKTKALTVGTSRKYGMDMGPVIDKKAYTKILEYIDIGKREGLLRAGGEKAAGNGYFIAPAVIANVRPDARIAQEEIFGPVLAVIKARDYNEALKIANSTLYGLTGAVYSNNREKLARAKREFHVGNLYLNRKCTGALVGVNPFGGFNMSGTDSKAGGPDYLTQFMQLKSISEKY